MTATTETQSPRERMAALKIEADAAYDAFHKHRVANTGSGNIDAAIETQMLLRRAAEAKTAFEREIDAYLKSQGVLK